MGQLRENSPGGAAGLELVERGGPGGSCIEASRVQQGMASRKSLAQTMNGLG